MISVILAMAKNAVIGNNNEIPWYIPNDFAYFKQVTMGHPIIMGRKTWESLGRPLPGRKNVVITRNVDKLRSLIEAADYKNKDVVVAESLESAFAIFGDECHSADKEIFVIGGAEIYRQAMPFADRLYLTAINHDFEGDTKFLHLNMPQWSLLSATRGVRDDKNDYEYSFLVYSRSNPDEDLICRLGSIDAVVNSEISIDDKFSVRTLTNDDYAKWEHLCGEAFEKECNFYEIVESRLGFSKDLVVGIFDGDKLVATASAIEDYTNDANAAFLHMICCSKDYRGRGLGKVVVMEILKRVRAMGFTAAWLKTQNYRTSAVRLYENLGFEISICP